MMMTAAHFFPILPPSQVGSDDFDIRIFQNEDVVAEVSEADQILALAPVHLTKWAVGGESSGKQREGAGGGGGHGCGSYVGPTAIHTLSDFTGSPSPVTPIYPLPPSLPL